MSLLLLTAAAVILGGVVVVAKGRGGELAVFGRDRPDVPLRLRTPSDVAGLRLPLGAVGYQVQAVAAALTDIARLLAERDAEIAGLRDELRRVTAETDAIPAPAVPAPPADAIDAATVIGADHHPVPPA